MGRYYIITLQRLGFLSLIGSTSCIADLESLSVGATWSQMWGSMQPHSRLETTEFIGTALDFQEIYHPRSIGSIGGIGLLARGLMTTPSSLLWGIELGMTIPFQGIAATSLHTASYNGIKIPNTLVTQIRPTLQSDLSVLVGRRWGDNFLTYFKVGGQLTRATIRQYDAVDDGPYESLGRHHKTWLSPRIALGIGWMVTPQWEIGAEAFVTSSRSFSVFSQENAITSSSTIKVGQAGLRFQLIYHLWRKS